MEESIIKETEAHCLKHHSGHFPIYSSLPLGVAGDPIRIIAGKSSLHLKTNFCPAYVVYNPHPQLILKLGLR